MTDSKQKKKKKTDLESVDRVAIFDEFVASLIRICNHGGGLLGGASYKFILP